MFIFNWLDDWPWEQGLEPDARNKNGSIWIEEKLTKQARTNKLFKNVIVGIYKPSKVGYSTWIIYDNDKVLFESQSIEAIAQQVDMMSRKIWRKVK